MSEYFYINNYSNKGKLAINRSIFESLVNNVLSTHEGIFKSKKHLVKNQSFQLNRPVNVVIRSGIVHIKLFLDASKNTNLHEISLLLQNEIADSLMVSTEQIPFDIQVNFVSII